MILTWFNNNNGCLYTRFYSHYILNNYYVGFKNSYNHEVVQILILSDNILYNVKDYYDYMKLTSNFIKKNKVSHLKMLIYKLQEFTS